VEKSGGGKRGRGKKRSNIKRKNMGLSSGGEGRVEAAMLKWRDETTARPWSSHESSDEGRMWVDPGGGGTLEHYPHLVSHGD